MRNKDGSESKRYTIAWECEDCGELKRDVHIHHIEEVGEFPDYPFQPGELEAWFNRQYLLTGEHYAVLCEDCHYKRHGKERRK
jgi:hypothetical protein